MTVSNPQNAIIAPELTSYNTYGEENRSKAEIIKLLLENISSGNNEVKEVLPRNENTFTEPSRKHSFKANERFGNQKTGNKLVLQNRFETLDVESNSTVHELPNRTEN